MMRHTGTMSEQQFQAVIIEAATLLGWRVYHTYDSRKSTGPGYPDLTMCKAGRLLCCELKSERGRIKPEQQDWLDTLATVPGIETYVWKPHQLDEIVAILQKS